LGAVGTSVHVYVQVPGRWVCYLK